MSDNEKDGKGTTSPRGNEWEVVSLTASVYAAAPGPGKIEQSNENKSTEYVAKDYESSDPMLMSGHFQMLPNEIENLLKEPDCKGVQKGLCKQDICSSETEADEPCKNYEESCKIKSDDDLHGINQFFDKEKSLSIGDMEFGDGKTLQGLGLIGEEPSIYTSSEFKAFHSEREINRSVYSSESSGIVEPNDPSNTSADSFLVDASVLKEGSRSEGSGVPSKAWWKRQVEFLYSKAKETNTFWSVFVAAALVGIVVLGRRWQREKLQLQQLKLQFNISNERSFMAVPFSRFKAMLVAGNQHRPLMQGDAAFGR
uniref:ATG8-interacting protein 1 n=1 Tax=Ananas comosus var. bracteatus TaxID=296719 RepID=A0A6V7NQU2_ANACO|nr:unnamed protein product [Ananas comosus var. bracteatus]